MRPLRPLLTCASVILGLLCLTYLATAPSARAATIKSPVAPRFSSPLSWSAPSSLFPPSAVIRLTDDNSTFFLARPASFGPALPVSGLSGQLWVGSGFGNDRLRADDGPAGSAAAAEGELGCSDVPGWRTGRPVAASNGEPGPVGLDPDHTPARDGHPSSKHGKRSVNSEVDGPQTHQDGTDNHLHSLLGTSDASPSAHDKYGHADIQSIQESAEIAGKVVLLTRGGCGFLEKVKWVQRRGGSALIVGDDVRGGALVTMYARGDTSNITIPSLFTSYTTAHLLSSLMPAGGRLGSVSHVSKSPAGSGNSSSRQKAHKSGHRPKASPSKWLRWLRPSRPHPKDSRRPPASGKNEWLLQDTFGQRTTGITTGTSGSASSPTGSTTTTRAGDGFVIGVNDWRDPDLLADKAAANPAAEASPTGLDGLSINGGSIMPGSGDYTAQSSDDIRVVSGSAGVDVTGGRHHGELGWRATGAGTGPDPEPAGVIVPPHAGDRTHQGLWVTLQPTSVSSSPFFDALLVLVVSPLVTLTVVYALLLLRARVRRRRWRAPKSVVEQLPVRTYQTCPGPSRHGSRAVSPVPTVRGSPTATTPLLPSAARPVGGHRRSRSRSHTDGQIVAGASHGMPSTFSASSFGCTAEKREGALAEWKRKYGGRQRECVVCLEEYVDRVSKVMSLPCGHDFHVECITPWLTTRRRTCPICKGDVVRSLARSNGPSTSPDGADTRPRLYGRGEEDEVSAGLGHDNEPEGGGAGLRREQRPG